VTGLATNTTQAVVETPDNNSVPINTDLSSLPVQTTQVITQTSPWVYILLGLSLLVNLVLGYFLWKANRVRSEQQEVNDYFANQSVTEEKEAWKQLRLALNGNDAKNIRQAMIHWGKTFWHDEQLTTL